ncbi:hypothetical protein GCM10009530_53850 [Microbispora corallina]|uniref:Uncharacterized protein n=1 Tax=Microbispora corallina TaxID=83302 RepID=A0ABQ4G4L5_9ACTN|nr:hypothetical protein [Microbispora corallina]GIH42027.1 hypothetical protein Mco01_50270 [Microbispora corallina]
MEHSGHNLLQAGSQTAISDRMRELLARAAQDHVYEQRTQGAVLDEIRQRLEGMEWLLREVRERELGGLSGALEALNGRLDEMAVKPPAWAEGLAQHMELLRDHVDAVGGHTQGLAERMTEFAQRLAQFQTSMEAAAGRFTRLDKAMAALGERTERLESALLDRLDAVDERIEVVGERVGRLPSELRIGELNATVGEVNAEVMTVTSALAPLVEAVRNRPDREQMAETVAGAVTRIVEPAHGDVTRRLAALEETMLALAEALLRPTRSPGD